LSAAFLLQAAFNAADSSRSSNLTASELFIKSGFGGPELVMHESGNYSFFCQGMEQGGRDPQPFHHAPEKGGWNDQPGLP